MESLFYRYRNIIVLLLVICAQIVLLAWQVEATVMFPGAGLGRNRRHARRERDRDAP